MYEEGRTAVSMRGDGQNEEVGGGHFVIRGRRVCKRGVPTECKRGDAQYVRGGMERGVEFHRNSLSIVQKTFAFHKS